MPRISRLAPLAALVAAPFAAAQDVVVRESSGLSLDVFLSTILYGFVGVLMCVIGYLVFDKIIGLNIKHELVEDQNTAVGIMLAGAFIGIAIVVAAVMLS